MNNNVLFVFIYKSYLCPVCNVYVLYKSLVHNSSHTTITHRLFCIVLTQLTHPMRIVLVFVSFGFTASCATFPMYFFILIQTLTLNKLKTGYFCFVFLIVII